MNLPASESVPMVHLETAVDEAQPPVHICIRLSSLGTCDYVPDSAMEGGLHRDLECRSASTRPIFAKVYLRGKGVRHPVVDQEPEASGR